MKANVGHILRSIQSALQGQDYKRFAAEVQKLFEFLKDTGDPACESASVVAGAALKVYNNFMPQPVYEIYSRSEKIFNARFAEVFKEKLSPDLELYISWRKKMDFLYRERLAREIRETVRADDYEQALSNIRDLLATGGAPEDLTQNLKICGNILGSLTNDQERVKKVMRFLKQDSKAYGLTSEQIDIIENMRQERFNLIFKSQVENRELEWSRSLADTARELKTVLPHPNDLNEPTFDEIAKIRRVFQAIFNTAYEPKKQYRFTDIIVLFSEFCPHPVNPTSTLAGADARIYEGLGKKARLILTRIFEDFGGRPTLSHTLLEYVSHELNQRYYKYALEVMSYMRSAVFVPFLMDMLNDKKHANIREYVLISLGNIGNPEIAEPLMFELESLLSGGGMDPSRRRRALHIIKALVRIVLSPALSNNERNHILKVIIKTISDDDTHLRVDTALEIIQEHGTPQFLNELDEDILRWLTISLVNGLWLKDPTPSFARAEERQLTLLGFRERIARALIEMGKSILRYLVEAAIHNIHQFCGAYMALGEILSVIGDDQTIALLEKMIVNTYIIEDKETTIYEQEYYWDPGEGKRMPLTRDKIASSLIYALNKIDTEAARDVLINLLRQIQNGQLAPLGNESSKVLMDANMRIARERGTSVFASEKAEGEEPDGKTPPVPRRTAGEMEEEIQSDIKTLQKGSILTLARGTLRKEKILAIQRLSKTRRPDAVAAIVHAVSDSDRLVHEAATTALYDLLGPLSPPDVIETTCSLILDELDKRPHQATEETLKSIIARLDFSRPSIKNCLEQVVQKLKSPRVQDFVQKLFQKQTKPAKDQKETEQEALFRSIRQKEGEQPSSKEGKTESSQPTRFVDKLEIRRRYMEERRRWIQGGKQGSPPEPPPDFNNE